MIDPRLKYCGSLLECFVTYPLFADDFDLLVEKGYLKQTAPDKCKWLKSKTCLAEYFRWINKGVKGAKNVKWKPIAKTFGIDKDNLTDLAGTNGNIGKRFESKDFEKLKRDFIPPYREKLYRTRWENEAYYAIKRLINKKDENNPEEIHVIMKKIQEIMSKNCG